MPGTQPNHSCLDFPASWISKYIRVSWVVMF
jgi:hypothetical protein